MDYQELYDTIESKVKDINRDEEYKFELAVNIYLVTLGLRTAFGNELIPEIIKDLDFVEYIKVPNKKTGRFFKFVVNKDFYKSNIKLFERLGELEDTDESDFIYGKIINYPCAGKLSEINSKKHIIIEYIAKKDSLETQIFAYKCPYDVKEKNIKEAKKYLTKIKKVLKIVNIKASLEINEQEANKKYKKIEMEPRLQILKEKVDVYRKFLPEIKEIEHKFTETILSKLSIKEKSEIFKILNEKRKSLEKELDIYKNNELDLTKQDLTNDELISLDLPENSKINLSYNKIKKIPNLKNVSYKILRNPVSKKIYNFREFNQKYMFTQKIKAENVNLIKLPKGTLLFRQYHTLEDVKSSFIGYKNPNNTENYYLHPDHKTFFYTFPGFKSSSGDYGSIDVIFVLQNDVELFYPNKQDIIKNYYAQDIKETSMKSYIKLQFDSKNYIKDDYLSKNIMGWYVNANTNLYVNTDTISLEAYKQVYKGNSYTRSEVMLYPKNKRIFEDVITLENEFDEDYMKKHLKEFNYKPFMIFDETVSSIDYKSIFDKLLSVEGFTNNDGTFHVTVNKIDGTYVLAEEASEDTLKNCVPINENRVEYLKEYIASQK